MEHTPTILAELEDYLKRENLTLAQFAEHSGIHPRTLSNLRNEYRPIAVHQLDQITLGMRLPEGFYYDLYIDHYIIDRSPDWRRIEPLLHRCTEMDKLDAIQRVVQHIMEKLMYAPMLFDTAEELFAQGRRAAALLLYESVAEGERFQHSERLALCQYRLFTLKLGDDQEQNLQTALQFEPFVERLDEVDQLDALKNLADAYRSLRRWDKVYKIAVDLKHLAKIQYSMPPSSAKERQESHKKPVRTLFYYVAYSNLLIGGAYYEQANYELALQVANEIADLEWVKETDEETLRWKTLFQEWAEANIYLTRLMAGEVELLSDYVNFIESKKNEILTGLWNIMIAANRYYIDVDHVLVQFATEISNIQEQEGNLNNQQNTDDQLVGLLSELADYYLFRGKYEKGFLYLLDGMKKSTIINDESSMLRCMRLFERYRKFALAETKLEYHNLVKVGENYEEKNGSVVHS